MVYDFAVIGSGVSGGRIAWELTRSGARCILIEAGPAFDRKTFPRNEMNTSTQLFWGGGLEVTRDGRLGLLRARCLGGTSIVNQALLDRFDEIAWEDWRDESGITEFSPDRMEPFYAATEQDTPHRSIPEQYWNRNARLFVQAYDNLELQWKPLVRAESDCRHDQGSDCIVCLGGCPRDSKQSSLVTTIRRAVAQGLTVESDFEVGRIDDSGQAVRIFGRQRGAEKEVRAQKAVLACGSLGNTKILHQSGFAKDLPALGKRFSCHPQFMTYALFDEPVDAHKGPLQAVKSQDPGLRKAGYKFENVFAGPIATAMLIPDFGRKHLAAMKKYRHLAAMEVAMRDDNVGTIRVASSGKIVVDKPLTAADRRRLAEGLDLIDEFYASLKAKMIVKGRQGFGLHLMGGCAIGVDAKTAVVDPEFRIFGHPRLYAADSSIFPSAPGINPSFTIMALSLKASQGMVRR